MHILESTTSRRNRFLKRPTLPSSGLSGVSFSFNESGNLRRPCMIIDNPEVLRKLVAEHIVPQGHEHAEDIIRNPKVVHWIDHYAQRMNILTEMEWQRKIEVEAAQPSKLPFGPYAASPLQACASSSGNLIQR
jgi:hypothetical protein